MEKLVAQWQQFEDEEKHMRIRTTDLRKKKRMLESNMADMLAGTQEKRCIVNGLYITLQPAKKREASQSMQKKLEHVLSATGEMRATTIENVLHAFVPTQVTKPKIKISPYKLK